MEGDWYQESRESNLVGESCSEMVLVCLGEGVVAGAQGRRGRWWEVRLQRWPEAAWRFYSLPRALWSHRESFVQVRDHLILKSALFWKDYSDYFVEKRLALAKNESRKPGSKVMALVHIREVAVEGREQQVQCTLWRWSWKGCWRTGWEGKCQNDPYIFVFMVKDLRSSLWDAQEIVKRSCQLGN